MKGIRGKGQCIVCKELGNPTVWKYSDNTKDVRCSVKGHGTTPDRFQISIFYKGTRIRRETTFSGSPIRSYGDAHALQKQADDEKNRNVFDIRKWQNASGKSYLFEVWIEKYYDFKYRQYLRTKKDKKNLNGLSKGYMVVMRSYIDAHIMPYFRGQNVTEIMNVSKFSDHLMDESEEGGKELSDNYTKAITSTLINFFKWLKDEKEIINNVPRFRKINPKKQEIDTIDREAIESFFMFIKSNYRHKEDIGIFAFLCYQGMRPSEILTLKWENISKDNETVHICSTWSGREYKKSAKNSTSNRYNYIFPETREYLPQRRFPKDFIFRRNNGQPISYDCLHARYKVYMKEFNELYKNDLYEPISVTPYKFSKHSWATHMYNEEGIDLSHIQQHFGHTDIKTTMIYTKVNTSRVWKKLDEKIKIHHLADTKPTPHALRGQ